MISTSGSSQPAPIRTSTPTTAAPASNEPSRTKETPTQPSGISPASTAQPNAQQKTGWLSYFNCCRVGEETPEVVVDNEARVPQTPVAAVSSAVQYPMPRRGRATSIKFTYSSPAVNDCPRNSVTIWEDSLGTQGQLANSTIISVPKRGDSAPRRTYDPFPESVGNSLRYTHNALESTSDALRYPKDANGYAEDSLHARLTQKS